MVLADPTLRRRAGAVLTVLSVLAIGFLTLRPGGHGPPPTTGAGYLTTDVVLNILLFTPLGVGLALLGLRPAVVLGLGATASTAIELSQLWVIPGRFASLHDVVTNTAGAGLAALAGAHWEKRKTWWGAMSPWILGGLTVAWVTGAFLVAPSSTRPNGLWFSQWAYEFGGQQFSGRVDSLSLQGIAVQDGRLPETDRLRRAVRESDTLSLKTLAVTGGGRAYRAQIVTIIAGFGEELVAVWQRGTRVRARVRLRLSDAWLRNPWVSVEDALVDTAGAKVRIEVTGTRKWIRLDTERDGVHRARTLRLTPDLFWSSFFPFDYDARQGTLWWPVMAAAPTLGLLGLAGHRRRAWTGVSLLVSLIGAPLLAGISLPSWPLVACTAVCVSAGMMIARRLEL